MLGYSKNYFWKKINNQTGEKSQKKLGPNIMLTNFV
jgi:hypothetical protein